MKSRKPKTYYATRGHLTAAGASVKDAKANLAPMVDWACRASMPIVESRFGLLIVVAASPNGYCTAVINPSDMPHGKRMDSFCQHPQGAYTDALESGRVHAAQVAWNADVADDSAFVAMAGLSESKARDLARWVEFQRGYIAAKAAGHDNGMAWRIASNDPTLPRVAA